MTPVVSFGSSISQSLATLRRHASTVVIDYRAPAGSELPPRQVRTLTPIEFHSHGDAVLYLRYWKRDAGAMASLRTALARVRQGPIHRLSDDQVIEALASYLAHGELVGVAEGERLEPDNTPITGTSSAAAAAAAAPADVVSAAAPASMLPQLEVVQIEGAEVLPEVLQTLDELEVALGTISVATVSLEPTPSGVSAINTELTGASTSITATLDDL